MSQRVKVGEPTHTDRAFWTELSEAELDGLVGQFIQYGDDMAASRLLIRSRGCSPTEAHKLVEEQACRI